MLGNQGKDFLDVIPKLRPHQCQPTAVCVRQNGQTRDFPSGPVVKNLTFSVGDTSSIPDQGIKIVYAPGQLSPHTARYF